MENITIELDLNKDLENFLRDKFKKVNLMRLGIDVSDEELQKVDLEDLNGLITLYSRLRNRLLLGRKRQVVLHKSLLKNEKYPVYKKKILLLKKIFENGSSIRPYLSNKVNELYSKDGLLLDWGVHHLHFTSCYSKNKRCNDILFIVEDGEKIHFIAILTHSDFYNTDILRYIYENCPTILEKYKLVGIKPPSKELTTQEIRNLRRYGVGYCVSFGGNTYAPNLNKKSNTYLVQGKFRLNILLQQIEKCIIEQKDCIFKQLYNQGATEISNISLEWIINSKSLKLQLYDKRNRLMCNFDCRDAPNPIVILKELNVI